jgi:hypothetical protein
MQGSASRGRRLSSVVAIAVALWCVPKTKWQEGTQKKNPKRQKKKKGLHVCCTGRSLPVRGNLGVS